MMPEKLEIAPDYWRKHAAEARRFAELIATTSGRRACWISRFSTRSWPSTLKGGGGSSGELVVTMAQQSGRQPPPAQPECWLYQLRQVGLAASSEFPAVYLWTWC